MSVADVDGAFDDLLDLSRMHDFVSHDSLADDRHRQIVVQGDRRQLAGCGGRVVGEMSGWVVGWGWVK